MFQVIILPWQPYKIWGTYTHFANREIVVWSCCHGLVFIQIGPVWDLVPVLVNVQIPMCIPTNQILRIQSEPLRKCYKFNHPPQGEFCSMEMWGFLHLCNDCWIVSADHDQQPICISCLLWTIVWHFRVGVR